MIKTLFTAARSYFLGMKARLWTGDMATSFCVLGFFWLTKHCKNIFPRNFSRHKNKKQTVHSQKKGTKAVTGAVPV